MGTTLMNCHFIYKVVTVQPHIHKSQVTRHTFLYLLVKKETMKKNRKRKVKSKFKISKKKF